MWSGTSDSGAAATAVKHDIFVGNLAFNTTEEQLHQVFSEVGRVIKVRMVTDPETGKPRGFAFVEFQDPQAALSAIRNMNDYELNGRRIRVNFSNSSHLEALAGKLGMDIPNVQTASSSQTTTAVQTAAGTVAVAEALKGMTKGELYDVISKLKEIADRDPEEARRILSGHPQLPEAILFCMSKLDMVQTPVATMVAPVIPQPVVPASAPTAATVSDPRQRVAADPRQQRAADPRQRAADPRARAPPPPPPPPPPQQPPPQQPPPQQPPPQQPPSYYMATNVPPGLDPALVQQVMSLTPQQIAQLPPDKQQSIMALRNQITAAQR